MLDQHPGGTGVRVDIRIVISHGPYIVRGDGGHTKQIVVYWAEVRTSDNRPRRSVPVHGEGALVAVPLLAHGPYIVSGNCGYAAKDACVGVSHHTPLCTVPV